MRRESTKRARENREYTRRRKVFLAEHENCARCWKRSAEVHHMAGREGWRLLYEPWWLALCSACHRHVTEHPVEAIEQGFSLPRQAAEAALVMAPSDRYSTEGQR